MADVFISYASEDRDRVRPLVARLEGLGYSIWWDDHLRGGSVFSQEIESALEESKVVLVFWTEASARSRWVADEADLALQHNKLIPIRLDDTPPPIGFRQIQTIDLSRLSGQPADLPIEKLSAAIGNHIASPSLPLIAPKPAEASIAVLAFVNMSSDPEQEYFSDGLAEELLNLLTQIEALKVTSRTSSFAFKGSDKSISEIGEQLGVAHVLEGSVRKAGRRIRVTAQLIEAATGFHLWSATYDRTLDDIFAVQDEISAAIVSSLRDKIIGKVDTPRADRRANIEAYDFYLLGRQRLNTRTAADLERSREYFEQAIALDPDYSRALAALAFTHMLLSDSPGCYGTTPIADALALAKPLLMRALDIDPASSELNRVLSLYYDRQGNHREAIRSAEKAVSGNVNSSEAVIALGLAIAASGDPAAAHVETLRRAIELDPLAIVSRINLILCLTQRQRLEEARAALAELEAIEAPASVVANTQCVMLMGQGRYRDVIEILWRQGSALRQDGMLSFAQTTLASLGYAGALENVRNGYALECYADLGLLDDARRLGNQLLAGDQTTYGHRDALALANWLARDGRCREALDLIEPYDRPEASEWGAHFALASDCLGSRLTLYTQTRCGEDEQALQTLDKLKRAYHILRENPEGVHYITHVLGAIVAAAEGRTEVALDALERQTATTLYKADVFLRDPNLECLENESRYATLLANVDEHFASEREAAESMGLLPVPEAVLAALS